MTTLTEKMSLLRESVRYALEDRMGCMDCLRSQPGDATYLTNPSDYYSAFGPSQTQIQGIVDAIVSVGLTPLEVDIYMASVGAVEGGRGTGFRRGEIGGCIAPEAFLRHMEDLLRG